MTKIQYKCTLLSDLVLSESSASEGQHRSLDFIPGNNFLGVVADRLYNSENAETSYTIFHSGKVRFGDAHPSKGDLRGLRIPASFFYPKGEDDLNEIYVHDKIKDHDAIKAEGKQPKQCRAGFYTFDKNTATKVNTDKDFAIKSAYDSDTRRSKDSQMFGYESIAKGTKFYFEVELDDDASQYADIIEKALVGERHLGRSRSAQYGWVKIEKATFTEYVSDGVPDGVDGKVTVYADGRLIFFDKNGMPTLRPEPQDLGFSDGSAKIDWALSQVRTFQYSPWNYTRQAFDSDRIGVEKGSVFVVKTSEAKPEVEGYVGAYQNEGFGKVLYNPSFLKANIAENGRSTMKIEKAEEPKPEVGEDNVNTPLIAYLKGRKQAKEEESNAYSKVEGFVDKYEKDFKSDKFASQWGTIRGIAMTSTKDNIRNNIEKYLNHGIAKDKWDDNKRSIHLFEFIIDNEKADNLPDLIVNLASRMAKETRQE